MRVRRAGDAALLIETEAPHRLNAAVRDLARPEVVDVVPGAETLLVTARPGTDLGRLGAILGDLPLPESYATSGEPLRVPVVYDGADLDEVASLTGLSREEVVARHADAEYVVAYLGFSPGFGMGLPLSPLPGLSFLEAPAPSFLGSLDSLEGFGCRSVPPVEPALTAWRSLTAAG